MVHPAATPAAADAAVCGEVTLVVGELEDAGTGEQVVVA
jgi:hypothetical protein